MRKTILLLIVCFVLFSCNSEENLKLQKIEKELANKEVELAKKNAEIAKVQKEREKELNDKKKLLIEKRISELTNLLDLEYKKMGKFLEERNKIEGFQLLRSSTTRKNQLNAVQFKIDECLVDIDKLEREMKKINPNWVVENQIEESQEVY